MSRLSGQTSAGIDCRIYLCETLLGILLLLGLWSRWVSLASAGLLAMFGTSMAISQGLKSPMDYSVYSASSAAMLLALRAFTTAP
jgi:putative oxidoreductase